MKMPPLIISSAAVVLMALAAVAARLPSASQDSEAAALDTRIGNVAAAAEGALDSRIGSWADSNLRGLNTTKMGASLIIR